MTIFHGHVNLLEHYLHLSISLYFIHDHRLFTFMITDIIKSIIKDKDLSSNELYDLIM